MWVSAVRILGANEYGCRYGLLTRNKKGAGGAEKRPGAPFWEGSGWGWGAPNRHATGGRFIQTRYNITVLILRFHGPQ